MRTAAKSGRTLQLQDQLDEIQHAYARQSDGTSSTLNEYYQLMRGSGTDAGETRYEQFLTQRNRLSALEASSLKGSKREDMMLLKDGLDLSLHNMRDDAARMRQDLTELGLTLGAGRRANIEKKIQRAAIPSSIAQQFTDQQRILVDQRRILEQLRHERQLEETSQFYFLRENRQLYDNYDVNAPGAEDNVPLPPTVVSEAHALLRETQGTDKRLVPVPAAGAPRDGYLLVEFISLAGFAHKHLYDTTYQVRVVDKSNSIVAKGAVDGPLQSDGSVRTRRLQLSIPPLPLQGQLDVELGLSGPQGEAFASVDFWELSDVRGDPRPFTLHPSGAWAVGDPVFGIEAALCAVPPTDAHGHPFAHTRVQKHGVTGTVRSQHPGPELPPSQAFLKEEAAEWEKKGCPVEVDEAIPKTSTLPGGIAQQLGDQVQQPGTGGRGDAGKVRVAAGGGGGSQRPARQQSPREEEEPEPAFFAGWTEQDDPPSDEPEPMPQPSRRTSEDGTPRTTSASGLQGRRQTVRGQRAGAGRRLRSSPATHRGEMQRPEESGWLAGAFSAFASFTGSSEASSSTATAATPARKAPSAQSRARRSASSSVISRAAAPAASWHEAEEPPFAAFAGDHHSGGGGMDGIVDAVGSGLGMIFGDADEVRTSKSKRQKLLLKPPSSLRTLEELFMEMRHAVEDGHLGAADVAQDFLEFAARNAQPGLLEREKPDEADLSKYAAMLIDGLDAYPVAPTLTMWGVEGLVSVFNASGRLRAQLSVPIFAALARACLNFDLKEKGLAELHNRLLAGLAATASPDCIAPTQLVDYILGVLESKKGRTPPLTAEHALAILCAVRSNHRLGTQVRHTLLLLRSFKSDAHLASRMLVTLAELYEVMHNDMAADSVKGYYKTVEEEEVADVNIFQKVRVSAFDRGVPDDLSDVRLAVNVLDLYPNNRKVVGSAIRALASMAKLSAEHLQASIVDELRAFAQAQHRHGKSRSVHLNCAQIVNEVTRYDLSLVTKGVLLLVSNAQRAFPQDPDIALPCMEALARIVRRDEHREMLLEAVPAHEIVRLGETHCANPGIVGPVCSILAIESAGSRKVREELVKCSAVAVPFRALDYAWSEASLAQKAAEAVKRLTARSHDALRQVHRCEGILVLWKVLERHQENAGVVREAISAIAGVSKSFRVREQLVDYWKPETLDVLDQLVHIATNNVGEDGDILAQTSLALGALTANEDQATEHELRSAIDVDLLMAMIRRAGAQNRDFIGEAAAVDLCMSLIRVGLTSDLYVGRVLSKHGEIIANLPTTREATAAVRNPSKDPRPVTPRTQRKEDAPEQVGADDDWDIFYPLRGLGIGMQHRYGGDERAIQEEASEEEEAASSGEEEGAIGSMFAAVGL